MTYLIDPVKNSQAWGDWREAQKIADRCLFHAMELVWQGVI